MANTLTGLFQTIYAAFDVVSRELQGFIPAVSMDAQAEQVTLFQNITSPIVPSMQAKDISPSNVSTTGTDQAIDHVNLQITKQRIVPFHLTGEEERGLQAGGTVPTITTDRFAQAFRTLSNEVEADLAALAIHSSRAYGTAGTPPFSTADDLTDLSELGKILDDNGAPRTGRSLILSSDALAKLQGKQPTVFRVNESGEPMGRRMGAIGMLLNFDIGSSGLIRLHDAAHNISGVAINKVGGEPVGATELTVDGGGSGETLNAGDVITLAGDTEKYVVAEAMAAGATSIKIAAPGLRQAAADNTAITALNDYLPSVAFTRNAFHLAARLPAVPAGGDMASDRMSVADPHSGLQFEVAIYRQYRQVTYEVGLAWGVAGIKPEHAALLLG